MKKIIAVLTVLFVGLSITACALPSNKETVQVAELADYTIVYPSNYKDWQMEEVYLLQNTIEHITGTRINAVPDSEPEAKREIILASSSRETAFSSQISSFANRMDYVVAVDNKDIVLGGLNYYSDMRAVYDFVNNYLGYDDIEDIYSESKAVSGTKTYMYKEPSLTLMGSNLSVSAYTSVEAVRDMAECNFNMIQIMADRYTDEEMRNFAKWCARYEIRVLVYAITDFENETITVTDLEDAVENPMIWGHYIKDEPVFDDYGKWSNITREYVEKYSKYGWKAYMNHCYMHALDSENAEIFKEAYAKSFGSLIDIFSYDVYYGHLTNRNTSKVLSELEACRQYALDNGQDFWNYIESYRLIVNNSNTSKMFRWHSYVSLCFGATGIEYFQYGDCSPNASETRKPNHYKNCLIDADGNKLDAWYDARKTNAELLKIADVYAQYDNVGAYTINRDDEDYATRLCNPYDFSDVITDFKDSIAQYEDVYLVGCFDKKDGDGHAFILVNMEPLNDYEYGKDIVLPIGLKINGETVNFYRDGELCEVNRDEDGYYLLEAGNGSCWFVTVD